MKKRALCALLAALLCVSLLPVSALAAEDVKINKTNFPDPVFRKEVNLYDIDNNGSLSRQELTRVKVMNVSGLSIYDLTGLEHFIALRQLLCDDNPLASLDISQNSHLLEAYVIGEESVLDTYTLYSYEDILLYLPVKCRIICLSISKQPESRSVAAGKTATLSVKANGYELQYQWYVQKKGSTAWNKVSGGASPKLTVNATASMDGNKYRCEVNGRDRDGTVSITSQAAKLTVIAKPKITTQPMAASVAAGKAATFKVKATGTGLKYQWYVMKAGTTKWAKLSGKTAATLKLTAKKNMNGNQYRCRVKNIAGSVYSKAVKLTVK